MDGFGRHVYYAARFVIESEIIRSVTVFFTFRYTLSAWSSLAGPSDLFFGITCSWQRFCYIRRLATACECVSSEAGSLVIQGCRRSANRWRSCAQRGWCTLATLQCISCCMCVCSTFSALAFVPPLSDANSSHRWHSFQWLHGPTVITCLPKLGARSSRGRTTLACGAGPCLCPMRSIASLTFVPKPLNSFSLPLPSGEPREGRS